jgi:hypothetical protein
MDTASNTGRERVYDSCRGAARALADERMTRLTSGVEQAIDAICALGCDVVRAYILALGTGEMRPEYAALDAAQRASLLAELQDIMAVYENREP